MTYKKKSGILTAVVVILVIALLVGALAAFTSGFTNWDVTTWFGQDKQEDTEEEEQTEPVQDSLVASIAECDGISLLMAPATVMDAATGETRSAGQTVSVSNAEDGVTYSWALSWSGDGNAADYVSLSASTGTSVTVSAVQPFGTQIKLTCTASISGKNVSSAVCNLDYKKRLTGMQLNGVSITDGGTYSLDEFVSASDFFSAVANGSFTVTGVYSTGSVSSSAGTTQIIDAWSSYDDYSQKYEGNSSIPTFGDILVGLNLLTESIKTQIESNSVDEDSLMIALFAGYELRNTVFKFQVGLVSTDADISGSYTINVEYPSSWVPAFSYNVSLNTPSVIF